MTNIKQVSKEQAIVAYKVFSSDWTCRDFRYEVGKTYTLPKPPIPCEYGFHACENVSNCFNYYDFNTKNKVAKVLLFGMVAEDGDKICANNIIIVDELSWEQMLKLANSGHGNSGNWNSGDCNSGDCNSGDCNSGDCNSGDCNSGKWNSGDCNSGKWNSGNCNSGKWNSGDCNSGDCNSGDCNSGNCNSGNWNSGKWNSGDCNSGFFNIDTPKVIRVFGVDIDRSVWDKVDKPDFLYFRTTNWVNEGEMSDQEKIDNPKFYTAGGYLKKIPYKQAFKESFEKASKEDKRLLLALPNFNKDMFFEISGINIDDYDLS